MPQHIGIVACSAEGAALCYRTICAEGAQLLGGHAHPEVSMHTPSMAEYTSCLDRGDWPGVAGLMLGSARKLAAIGAGFLICPDNTIHQALPLVEPESPLPWLHIAAVVAAEAAGRGGYRRVGVLGTRWLTDSEVYPDQLAARGLACVRPDPADRDEVSRIIMDELVFGVFRPEAVASLQRVIGRMKDAGCDAVVLGCTEIPLIMNDANSPLPTLDSTRLLARAALRQAIHGPTAQPGRDTRPGARPAGRRAAPPGAGRTDSVTEPVLAERVELWQVPFGLAQVLASPDGPYAVSHSRPWASGYPLPGTRVAARMFVRQAGAGGAQWGLFQIILRQTGEVIGDIGFHGPPDEAGTVEIGYGIVEQYRGRGLVGESAIALCGLAWSRPEVTRIIAKTEEGDAASAGVLRHAGFHDGGTAGGLRHFSLDHP